MTDHDNCGSSARMKLCLVCKMMLLEHQGRWLHHMVSREYCRFNYAAALIKAVRR